MQHPEIHEYTDHLGKIWSVGRILPTDANVDADRLSLVLEVEDGLALAEIMEAVSRAENYLNPDKVPADHQLQANFDRRVLGRVMMLEDAHAVLAAYPMFQAMELRGGANANQRASYLSITLATYNQIDERFSNVNGIAWFLNDEKNQIWTELPEGEID